MKEGCAGKGVAAAAPFLFWGERRGVIPRESQDGKGEGGELGPGGSAEWGKVFN